MGLKSLMVRAAKALDRLLLVLTLAHFFFSYGFGHMCPSPMQSCFRQFLNLLIYKYDIKIILKKLLTN